MISWVAMDRIVERKRAADAGYRKQAAGKVLRSDTYLAAMAVFVVTVVVAALLPARRALRIDPMRALRYE